MNTSLKRCFDHQVCSCRPHVNCKRNGFWIWILIKSVKMVSTIKHLNLATHKVTLLVLNWSLLWSSGSSSAKPGRGQNPIRQSVMTWMKLYGSHDGNNWANTIRQEKERQEMKWKAYKKASKLAFSSLFPSHQILYFFKLRTFMTEIIYKIWGFLQKRLVYLEVFVFDSD